ncbi:MAG: helix-turn-helix domain-containing protein [Mycobacterium sp.]|nr:helix-turn-helix domain-containing protein [Mycobacterium sp.]
MSEIVKSAKHRVGRRSGVLRVLRAANAPMSIVAIAGELDVHPNTVRFHLDTLVSTGRVEQVAADRRGPGRPALMFQAIRRMDPGGPRRYRVLAEILASGLANDEEAEAKALAAGQAWGRQLRLPPQSTETPDAEESIEHLVDLLDDIGFAPETGEGEQVRLRHCPFLELAETRTPVVCSIHQGIMQGALETWKAPVTVDRLEPFVEPDLCLVHLARPVAAM